MSADDIVGRTFAFLRERKRAYQLAFGNRSVVRGARAAYKSALRENYAGQAVLIDLAKFCRANETTFHPTQGARVQAILEGRRQVWLRITQHLHLTHEELFALYNGANIQITAKEENNV